MTLPLQLHPDYVKIKDKEVIHIPVKKKKKKAQVECKDKKTPHTYNTGKIYKKAGVGEGYFHTLKIKNPSKYRYITFHGKGDLVYGLMHFNLYFDIINTKGQKILNQLRKNRDIRAFSLFANISQSSLSHCSRGRRQVKRRTWPRLMRMKKIIREVDAFMLAKPL